MPDAVVVDALPTLVRLSLNAARAPLLIVVVLTKIGIGGELGESVPEPVVKV